MELTLPEELLLLCTNRRTGVVKCPQYFTRVLAGGVLCELRLRGAVVIDGSMIAEVRPMSTGDAVADEVLAKIVRHVQLGWPGARQTRLAGLPTDHENAEGQASASGWKRRLARAGATVRTVAAEGAAPSNLQDWLGFPFFADLEQRYLQALELRGLLTSGRHRALGVVPRTTWQAVSPDQEQRIFAGVDPEIRPHAHGRPAAPPSPRTVDLVALAHVASLTAGLYPSKEFPDSYRYIARLASGHPIAQIAEQYMEWDDMSTLSS